MLSRLRSWYVVVPVTVLVVGTTAVVVRSLTQVCADRVGGSSAADPITVASPDETGSERTAANRDFAGDDLLGSPV